MTWSLTSGTLRPHDFHQSVSHPVQNLPRSHFFRFPTCLSLRGAGLLRSRSAGRPLGSAQVRNQRPGRACSAHESRLSADLHGGPLVGRLSGRRLVRSTHSRAPPPHRSRTSLRRSPSQGMDRRGYAEFEIVRWARFQSAWLMKASSPPDTTSTRLHTGGESWENSSEKVLCPGPESGHLKGPLIPPQLSAGRDLI